MWKWWVSSFTYKKVSVPEYRPERRVRAVVLSAVDFKGLTCSQTSLYVLFKVRQARVIKYKPQGIYWQPVQGGSGGELTTPESTITYHNALCLSPQNFAYALSSISLGRKWPQEKLKTMLMQVLGWQTKSIMVWYGIFWSGHFFFLALRARSGTLVSSRARRCLWKERK